MGQAAIRITETLDLDAVLQGVVDGACSLTGARHGGVTVREDGRRPPVFISSGLTPEEHRSLLEMPGGLELFDHLSTLPEPLRIADFSAYAKESGLPEVGPPIGPMGAFLGAPVRHLGRRVGHLFLSDKEGDAEFTPEDEAILALFASQAALAISNARRYREEQRAKADLETLINTSPVGVVVFAAATGALLSVNREALRIVDGLRSPDQSVEQLLEVVTLRRADGREVSLMEDPLARALHSAKTVRAEEIVIQVPDGRRVSTIINATPILSEEGDIASVVVTLQDLAPVRDLGRQRAEFLSMVSQELLAPLTSIKGSAAAMLEDLTRLDVARTRQFFSIIERQADRMRSLIWDLLEVARIEAGTLVLNPEPTVLSSLVEQARASFVEGGPGSPVEVDLPQDLPPLAADRRQALQLLDRLLSTAADHSPGSVITVTARHEDSHVAVCVSGRAPDLPAEPEPLLFQRLAPMAGGSESASGGAALVLTVCRGIVEAHGGRIWVESGAGAAGPRYIFTLPVAEEAAQRHAGPAAPSRAGSRLPARGRGRVLVVDNDPQVLWHVRNTLTEAGYIPAATWDPGEVERLIATEQPHLVLLDAALAGADGSGLMGRISSVTDAPVVLLAGHGSNRQREVATAFESGADDYVAMPFSPTELVARVGAALRRREAPRREPPGESFRLGDLSIDYARRRVALAGRDVKLTDTEYRLLCEFALNAGRVLSREHLMSRVWSGREPRDSGVVRAYVKRLRQKLGEGADNPRYILNEPRIGYRLGEPEDQERAHDAP